jgi:hypothetical protein
MSRLLSDRDQAGLFCWIISKECPGKKCQFYKNKKCSNKNKIDHDLIKQQLQHLNEKEKDKVYHYEECKIICKPSRKEKFIKSLNEPMTI